MFGRFFDEDLDGWKAQPCFTFSFFFSSSTRRHFSPQDILFVMEYFYTVVHFWMNEWTILFNYSGCIFYLDSRVQHDEKETVQNSVSVPICRREAETVMQDARHVSAATSSGWGWRSIGRHAVPNFITLFLWLGKRRTAGNLFVLEPRCSSFLK